VQNKPYVTYLHLQQETTFSTRRKSKSIFFI